jgi:hypothetical protein
MGTFPHITQNGRTQRWRCEGQNITNHEVFAFTLDSGLIDPTTGQSVGALISDVTVYNGAQPVYWITLTAVIENPSATDGRTVPPFWLESGALISGNFESHGV